MANFSNSSSDVPEEAETDLTVEIIGLVIMLSIFSVVGSVGNGLVIFVFQRVRDKSTAQVFIITMAVIDLFTCMVIIPLTIFMEYTGYSIKFDFLCKLYHFLITSKIPLSAFIMVAIAFDRYFCICHPLRRIITQRRACCIVVCLALLASMLGIMTSLFYGVYEVVERIDSRRIDEVMGTNFTKSVTDLDGMVTLSSKNKLYMNVRSKLISTVKARNVTFDKMDTNYLPVTIEIVYIGVCNPSSVIFDQHLFHAYQRTYLAVFPICLITVMVLYFLIYRFMCMRRSKKLQQKLIMCSYVNGDGTYENTRLVNEEDNEQQRKNKKNKTNSTLALTATFSTTTPATCTNGVSPTAVHVRTTSIGNNTQDATKHGNNLLMDTTPRSKISTTSTTTTTTAATAITPTDNDDNTPILTFYNNMSNNNIAASTDRSTLVTGRRHSHLPEQKYQWHKNRDSMKRYKGKTKRRKSQYSYDADRLREENRSANVRTALMLFTVTLVFIVAFVPAWVIAHRIISHNLIVFYLYFIYNVANPFIYAFMNHIFKDYMRKMFACRELTPQQRRSS